MMIDFKSEFFKDCIILTGMKMVKPDTPIKSPAPKGHLNDLCEAISLTKSKDEVRAFITDLCTPSEIRAIAERWHVAQILDEGKLSYRDIYDQTGVSTATVGRVARFLKNEPHHGYRTILDRVQKVNPKKEK